MARAQLINPSALANTTLNGDDSGSSGGGGSLPSAIPAALITQDSTHRFVSDEQTAEWDAKLSGVVIKDDGATEGTVTTIDVRSGLAVSVSGTTATLTATGGGSGVTISGNSYFPAGWA